MTEKEWAEYYRRLKLRDDRREDVRRAVGYTDFAGWGRSHRTQYQQRHPELGGQVAAAVMQAGHAT